MKDDLETMLYRELMVSDSQNEQSTESFIDEEKRTVVLSFSSKAPVVRYMINERTGKPEKVYEVLDHSDGAIDLTRLQASGPVLLDHTKESVVGVVEDVWVTADKGFARVRFGRSAKATEVFNDIIDGIRRTVSVGYKVLEYVRQEAKNKGDLPTNLITRWLPYEVSLETIPADITVGVGRSEEMVETIINEDPAEETVESIETRELPIVEVKETYKMENNDRQNERKRLNGIRETANRVRSLIPDVDALAEDFMNSERSLDEFNSAVVAKIDAKNIETAITNAGSTNLGLSVNDKQRYSFLRAIEAAGTGNWKNAGYELELSKAIADRMGSDPKGFYVPFEVLAKRADAALANTTTAVGAVATEFWADEYIDILRANTAVVAAGARVLEGLQGNVKIPKATNGTTFGWVTEGSSSTGTQYSGTSLDMVPVDIMGSIGFTRSLMKQSGLSVENLIRDDMNAAIGVFVDQQCLVGTQAGASGVSTMAGTKLALTAGTWTNVLALEGAVGTANAETGKLSYITSPSVRAVLKGKVKDSNNSGAGGFIMNEDGRLNGYPCGITSNASTGLFFGNWGDLIIGTWGGLDILVDPFTNAANGGIVVRAFLSADIGIRNTGSFAVQTGIVG